MLYIYSRVKKPGTHVSAEQNLVVGRAHRQNDYNRISSRMQVIIERFAVQPVSELHKQFRELSHLVGQGLFTVEGAHGRREEQACFQPAHKV